jgi:hypothetical protein
MWSAAFPRPRDEAVVNKDHREAGLSSALRSCVFRRFRVKTSL